MDQIKIKKAQLKLKVVDSVDKDIPKSFIYDFQKEIEDLAEIEDKAEVEKRINNIIKEINSHKLEDAVK